ncbi:MAG: AzlD domain-containing protein [Actinomycetota bacterium]
MSAPLLLLVSGLVVLGLRASFLVPAGRITLPVSWRTTLEHARPAVLGALTASVVVGSSGVASVDPVAVAVAAIAYVVAGRAGMLTTVAVGFAAAVLLLLL